MPVRKKRTIPKRETARVESSASGPLLPEQQEFHQHLRALAQSAVRTVLEVVMREELDAFIGAAWGACNPKRKGYRNGSYTRNLATAVGRLEDLKVPRDREGQFHSQVFERYSRYEPHVARSASPRCLWQERVLIKWEKWPKPCWESPPAEVAISRLNQSLSQQFDTWRERRLQEQWRVLYLDGVHFSIRHGDKADATIILTADSEWIWKATKRGWHCAPVPKKAKRVGSAYCKTYVLAGRPRSTSS